MRSASFLAVVALLASCDALEPSSDRGPRASFGSALGVPACFAGARPEPAPRQAPGTSLSALDLTVGGRALDKDYWAPVEDQVSVALQFATQSDGSIVGFEGGLGVSYGDESDVVNVPPFGAIEVSLQATLFELYVGLHRSFGTTESTLRPYLGAGFTTILVGVEGDIQGEGSASDDDAMVGLYLHGGLPIYLSRVVRLGIDARFVAGTDVELFGAQGDVNYSQLSAFLGFAW